MKSIFFLATSLCISTFATAQVDSINPPNIFNHNPIFDLTKLPGATAPKFLYEAPLGKVYAMPPDNMPCLVPNFPVDNWMPAYNLGPLANPDMPNPIPRQEFPPKPLFNHHLLKHVEAPKVISKNLMLDLIRKK